MNGVVATLTRELRAYRIRAGIPTEVLIERE